MKFCIVLFYVVFLFFKYSLQEFIDGKIADTSLNEQYEYNKPKNFKFKEIESTSTKHRRIFNKDDVKNSNHNLKLYRKLTSVKKVCFYHLRVIPLIMNSNENSEDLVSLELQFSNFFLRINANNLLDKDKISLQLIIIKHLMKKNFY